MIDLPDAAAYTAWISDPGKSPYVAVVMRADGGATVYETAEELPDLMRALNDLGGGDAA